MKKFLAFIDLMFFGFDPRTEELKLQIKAYDKILK